MNRNCFDWVGFSNVFVDDLVQIFNFPHEKLFLIPQFRPVFVYFSEHLICLLNMFTLEFHFKMSSKYAIAKFRSLNIVSITCCKIPGAILIPKDNLLNLYNLLWVLIIKNFEHSSSTRIYKYASDESNFENYSPPFNFMKISS